MPAEGRVKRTANLGPGWLEAERGHDAELPGNISAKSVTSEVLAYWITGSSLEDDGERLHLAAQGELCCALKT